MKRFLIVAAILFSSTFALAQKADVAFVAGGSFSSDATVPTGIICITAPCPSTVTINTHHRYFLEGTGAVRLADFKVASLHLELPVAAIPSALLGGGSITLTSIYVTPSLRIKFVPGAPISPFASVGGGWAHYSTDVTSNKGALQYGGGVDIKTNIPLLAFRAEVRDFVTGQPDFTIFSPPGSPARANNDRRHNVLAGGGIVLRF